METKILETAYIVAVVALILLRMAFVAAEEISIGRMLPEGGVNLESDGNGGKTRKLTGYSMYLYLWKSILYGAETLIIVALWAGGRGIEIIFGLVATHALLSALVEIIVRNQARTHPGRLQIATKVAGFFASILVWGRKSEGAELAAFKEIVDDAKRDAVIDEDSHDLVHAVMRLNEKSVREILVPKHEVIDVLENATIKEARVVMTSHRLSRAPIITNKEVYVIHLKDLFVEDLLDEDLAITIGRTCPVVPEGLSVRKMMRSFQNSGQHLAAVADEYGEIVGIVTLEDCLEELVGEIEDEHDEAPKNPEKGGGVYVFQGSASIVDVNKATGLGFSNDEYTSLGGLVFSGLGRVGVVGETFETDEAIMRILKTDGNRIEEIEVITKTN
jgi:magnesium and cobalt transporter